MDNRLKFRKKRIVILALIAFFFLCAIGISFALWNFENVGNMNKISIEPISLEFLESTSEVIDINDALPMSDIEGKNQSKTFNFSVTTATKRQGDIGYSLRIEKLNIDDGYFALLDNDIKIYLSDYDNNALVLPLKISDLNNYVLFNKVNSHSSTKNKIQDKYKLRVWIDKDVDISNWSETVRGQYKFKINVEAYENVLS